MNFLIKTLLSEGRDSILFQSYNQTTDIESLNCIHRNRRFLQDLAADCPYYLNFYYTHKFPYGATRCFSTLEQYQIPNRMFPQFDGVAIALFS